MLLVVHDGQPLVQKDGVEVGLWEEGGPSLLEGWRTHPRRGREAPAPSQSASLGAATRTPP